MVRGERAVLRGTVMAGTAGVREQRKFVGHRSLSGTGGGVWELK